MNQLHSVFMDTPSAADGGSWDIMGFLSNATTNIKSIMGLVISLIGVIMIGVGIYKVAKALISHGKEQPSWVVNIALILVGGALMVGGWSFVADIAEGGQDTIVDLGKGNTAESTGSTIIPYDVLDGFVFDMGE